MDSMYIVEKYQPDLGVLGKLVGSEVFHDKAEAEKYLEEMKEDTENMYVYKELDMDSRAIVEVRYSR